MEAIELARAIEHSVNVMGNDDYMNQMVTFLSTMHRTLIQSFVGKFVIPYVKRMAVNYENKNYDTRNDLACKMCKIMFDALCKEYPYFKMEDFNLPMI